MMLKNIFANQKHIAITNRKVKFDIRYLQLILEENLANWRGVDQSF